MADFFTEYNQHVEERSKEGIPPLALTREQATDVVELLQNSFEYFKFVTNPNSRTVFSIWQKIFPFYSEWISGYS